MLDTNVVLDVLLDRKAFVNDSALLLDRVERGAITGLLCATTITTLACLAGKAVGKRQATQQIRQLLTLFEVAPVTRAVLDGALASKAPDFENAVLAEVHCKPARRPSSRAICATLRTAPFEPTRLRSGGRCTLTIKPEAGLEAGLATCS